jgi:hypothetical protein
MAFGFSQILTLPAFPHAIIARPRLDFQKSLSKSVDKKDKPEYWQKELAADPGNFILKKLARMAASMQNPSPFKPFKPPEIEEQDPVELGRGGHCNVAIEVLLELYPAGKPHKLTQNGNDCAHVFLMFKGQPLDICGVTSLEEMRTHYKDDSLKPASISAEDIQNAFCGWQTPDETVRLKAHFKKHILNNLGKTFPQSETQ